MVAVPQSFLSMPRWWHDEPGRAWLADLPELVATKCATWRLELDGVLLTLREIDGDCSRREDDDEYRGGDSEHRGSGRSGPFRCAVEPQPGVVFRRYVVGRARR